MFRTKKQAIINILAIIAIGLIVVVVAVGGSKKNPDLQSFQDCKNAGGQLAEIYPETCYYKDKSFINSQQATNYEGLAEQDALDKAKSQNTPARVIERDGVGLPATMDFSEGRLNFSVRDGKVYKVDIETTSR